MVSCAKSRAATSDAVAAATPLFAETSGADSPMVMLEPGTKAGVPAICEQPESAPATSAIAANDEKTLFTGLLEDELLQGYQLGRLAITPVIGSKSARCRIAKGRNPRADALFGRMTANLKTHRKMSFATCRESRRKSDTDPQP
jgi:hypothetical protein